jgi:UDPglucose 6-dehydrogenase
LRDSPAVAVITRLLQAGAHVVAHDPTVSTRRHGVPGEIELATSPLAACNGADVLCVLTEWPEYRTVSAVDVASALIAPRVVDTRNLLDRAAWEAAGFTYDGVGR